MVEAVHRLDREFGGALGRADIAQVVSWSHADLDGPHPAAMPELVERLGASSGSCNGWRGQV